MKPIHFFRSHAQFKTYILLFFWSALAVFISFIWQGHIGFNIADEGFLWYGTQRVLKGEIPLLDFHSYYEPGRFYWSAGIMNLLGDNGIMVLRIAAVIFQTVGLFMALVLITSNLKNRDWQNIVYLLLSTIILMLWMFPRHKLFDLSLSIMLISVLNFFIQNPTVKRYFFTGLCIGLVAVFGRNHGLYGFVGCLGIIIWLVVQKREREKLFQKIALGGLGLIAGFLPVLAMILFVPDYAVSFWESIIFYLEAGGTNLTLPIPWPWRVNFTAVPLGESIRGVLIGLFFTGILVLGIMAIPWTFFQRYKDKKVSSILVASAFLMLPYTHYAYSRADIGHLAHGIFPFLIACLILFRSLPNRWLMFSFSAVLLVTSLYTTRLSHPGWVCNINKNCVDIEIANDDLKVNPWTSNDINFLRELVNKYAPKGQNFLVTPIWPGAYSTFDRKSPLWEQYILYPRSKEFQLEEIERIRKAKPNFVLILDVAIDGRDELRFKNLRPLIYEHIREHFIRTKDSPTGSLHPAYQVYKPTEVKI